MVTEDAGWRKSKSEQSGQWKDERRAVRSDGASRMMEAELHALHVFTCRKPVEATNQTKVGCQAVIVYLKNAPEAVQIAPSRIDFIINNLFCISS
jgi:hypothetical protein